MGERKKKRGKSQKKRQGFQRDVLPIMSQDKSKQKSIPEMQQHAEENKVDFSYEVIILIVSLLHGNLFFLLADKLINLLNKFSFSSLSYLIFFTSVFIRVFQTHILAAIKSSGKWIFKPTDFIYVFFTALFEYLLFSSDKITKIGVNLYFYLIFAYCVFGIFGYLLTYLRSRKSCDAKYLDTEATTQTINIMVVFIVGVLHLGYYFSAFASYVSIDCISYISSFLLLLNVYTSLKLSETQLKQTLLGNST
ncbi:MAG: hypothetical protein LBO63_05495 [Oscillospiraceae bacterium]|jgi:hypothetical protein|nr:hypothetical protein [Oscillospiraceae bacterium]